jgi:hypothetical protein
MIRCVRMWTGEDGDSLFEEGWIDLAEGVRGDFVGKAVPVVKLYFQETRSGGSWAWHQDPAPRFVITLSGTLEFQTKSGATFTIRPGDVLLAQMELPPLTAGDSFRKLLRSDRRPFAREVRPLRSQRRDESLMGLLLVRSRPS